MYAPVALFVYDRIDNTKSTVEALIQNFYSADTDVFVFSDAGKDAGSLDRVSKVRKYLHSVNGFKSFNIIERPYNYYLEKNIIEGISYVLERFDRVIVLEDDVVTSPYFLDYMNEAFEKYEEEKTVMHLAGFSNLLIDKEKGKDTFFTPHMSGWGWGTWKDRWEKFVHYQSKEEALQGMSESDIQRIQYWGAFPCLKSLDKDPIPWDICWELAIYKDKGLCLTPSHTLVKNIGIYNGTHFKNMKLFGHYEYDRPVLDRKPILTDQNIAEDAEIEEMYSKAFIDYGMRYNILGKVIRFFVKHLKSYCLF